MILLRQQQIDLLRNNWILKTHKVRLNKKKMTDFVNFLINEIIRKTCLKMSFKSKKINIYVCSLKEKRENRDLLLKENINLKCITKIIIVNFLM